MKRVEEPVRWLDPASDVPEELRRMLAAGQERPDDRQWKRLESFVGGLGVAGTFGGAGAVGKLTHGAGHAVLKSMTVKIIAAVVVAGGTGVGAWTVTRHSSERETSGSLVGTIPRAVRVTGAQASSGVAGVLAPAVDEPAMATSAPAVQSAPAPGQASLPSPSRPAVPVRPLSGASSGVSEETEIALLTRAHRLVDASPGDALKALAEHRARFPHGALEQEREVLAIEALVRMGRMGEARARAAAFTVVFPSSAHARRIGVLFGADAGVQIVPE